MALMICPDCGTKISDTAEICINCGCDLFLHREELRIDREIEEKVIAFSEQMSQSKPPKQINSLSEIPMYRNTDNANLFLLLLTFGCIVFGLYCLSSGERWFSIVPAAVGIFPFIGYRISSRDAKKILQKEQERIQREIDNFEAGKRTRIMLYQQALLREKQNKLEEISKRNIQRVVDAPKVIGLRCPACDSDYYERISTLNRMISVELVGLASSKIGKQYKCKKCGHLW